jgi:hypothetical protein
LGCHEQLPHPPPRRASGPRRIEGAFDADQTYLRKPDCPYDNDTIDLLEKLFKAREIEVIKEVVVDKPERGKVGRPSSKKELNDDDAAELEAEAARC